MAAPASADSGTASANGGGDGGTGGGGGGMALDSSYARRPALDAGRTYEQARLPQPMSCHTFHRLFRSQVSCVTR